MELEENEENSFKAYREADQREPNEKRFYLSVKANSSELSIISE